jgi:plastocyanin
MRRLAFAALLLLTAAGEPGGSVRGTVVVRRDGAPAPADGVVVYVVGFDEPAPDRPAEIRQRGKQFAPELVAITAGQEVRFPNDDPFTHNVFSPSPAHRFDLGAYPRGEARSRRFPGVGVIDVFCNIHPQMAATLLVLPNRRFARAAADGRFELPDLPPGRWTLYAYSRRVPAPVSAPIAIVAGQTTEVELALDETRSDFSHPNKYGEPYKKEAYGK